MERLLCEKSIALEHVIAIKLIYYIYALKLNKVGNNISWLIIFSMEMMNIFDLMNQS